MIQDALAQLLEGNDLTRAQARRVMDSIMSGEATPAQIGGFLVALRLKGETAEEIAGSAEAMRAHAVAVRPARDDLVDTAGTGGDGGKTFNISTAAALLAAAAGAGVAKHGNRSVSSADSPLRRRAMRKPPICAGVASPLMISPMTSRASSRLRSWPSRSRARPSWIVIAVPPGSCARAPARPG